MEFNLCAVIGTHPSDQKKLEILEKCLKSLEPTGLFRIVTSHLMPNSEKVREMADVYFYEKSNEAIEGVELIDVLSPHSAHFFYKFDNHIYRSQLDLFRAQSSHHYAAFRNMVNGAILAKTRGFKGVIFTEGDNIFEEKDILYLVSRVKGCIRDGKRALFFRGHPTGVNALSVLVCYFEADFFLEKLGHIQSKEKWLSLSKAIGGDVTVEKILTSVLENSNEIKVLNVDSPSDDRLSQYFPLSETNLIDSTSQGALPIANFCSEWNPLFVPDKQFWFVAQGDSVSTRSRVFLRDKEGVESIFFENTVSHQGISIQPVKLNVWHASSVRFENVWNFSDGTEQRREFILTTEQFRKYLQLNTLQFEFS